MIAMNSSNSHGSVREAVVAVAAASSSSSSTTTTATKTKTITRRQSKEGKTSIGRGISSSSGSSRIGRFSRRRMMNGRRRISTEGRLLLLSSSSSSSSWSSWWLWWLLSDLYRCLMMAVCLSSLLVSDSSSSSSSSSLLFCSALRHSFYVKRDDRTLIGPVGEPFGFLEGGSFEISVFDFQLESDKNKKHNEIWYKNKFKAQGEVDPKYASEDPNTVGLEGGFFLLKMDNEASFNQYMEYLSSNHSICSFEYFHDSYYYNQFMIHNTADGGNDNGNDDVYPEMDDLGILMDMDDEFSDVGDFLTADHGVLVSMMDRTDWFGKKTFTYTFNPGEDGLYFLLYQICPPDDPRFSDTKIRSSFELDIHFKNYDSFNRPSYLSAGEMCLPTMFLFFTISYLLCFCIWVYNIQDIQQGNHGLFETDTQQTLIPTVYPIHNLMAVLLFLRTIATFFESIRYHFIRVTGHAALWSFVYYTFAFIKGVFLFTVILLIGSGWSSMKPFLNEREKKVIFAILILQVLNQLVFAILSYETEGEKTFQQWTAIFHIIDIICCCAVLLPIVWQVDALEKSIQESQPTPSTSDTTLIPDSDADQAIQLIPDITNDNAYDAEDVQDADNNNYDQDDHDDEAEDKLADKEKIIDRLKTFRSFYLLVVAYIYATRILIYLFVTMLDYRHLWVRFLVVELLTLAFYVVTGLQFRPKIEEPIMSPRKRRQRARAAAAASALSGEPVIPGADESELEMINVPTKQKKPPPPKKSKKEID